jgi:dTMP kinase
MRGLFIVFEGIDGSGKSSCIDAVASELERTMDVVRTAEPTGGEIKKLIMNTPGIRAETEALLFVADRAQHTDEIQKWLDERKIVICDRYYASTLAYQSAATDGRSLDMRWLRAMNNKVIIKPDLTFLFDIDPEKALERVESRGAKSRFERLGYLKEVREAYLRIAKQDGFKIIDASKPKEDVFDNVMKHILKLL